MARVSPFKLLAVAVIAIIFLTGAITFYADLDNTYDPNTTENFDAVFSDFSEITRETQNDTIQINKEIAANMSSASQNTVLTPIQSQKAAGFAGLRIIFKIPGLVQNLFNSISGYLGVPTWFLNLIITLIGSLISVVIILFVFNRLN